MSGAGRLDAAAPVFDLKLVRAAEAGVVCGGPWKARAVLGWTADIPLEALISEMVEADLARLRRGD